MQNLCGGSQVNDPVIVHCAGTQHAHGSERVATLTTLPCLQSHPNVLSEERNHTPRSEIASAARNTCQTFSILESSFVCLAWCVLPRQWPILISLVNDYIKNRYYIMDLYTVFSLLLIRPSVIECSSREFITIWWIEEKRRMHSFRIYSCFSFQHRGIKANKVCLIL